MTDPSGSGVLSPLVHVLTVTELPVNSTVLSPSATTGLSLRSLAHTKSPVWVTVKDTTIVSEVVGVPLIVNIGYLPSVTSVPPVTESSGPTYSISGDKAYRYRAFVLGLSPPINNENGVLVESRELRSAIRG
ncbi:MAG: hypothetical protein F4Y27_08980 [Acidimicrobiaceae bacterium]|nr:hypothetical protein [Acidimicrobiaceae bacterium]